MTPTKILSILAILFLLSLLTCPLMAASKIENSNHDCTGQQKQEGKNMNSCCNQQAIQAKAFDLKYCNSASMLFSVDSELTVGTSMVVRRLQDSAHLSRNTGVLLAKLSILRI